ncbi:MAG: alpha/beta hydrolase [Deltaproteobacteria bacterium]|nr:alpha/beta hydrolase [Deltaproteobacteria bacterium]
MKNTLYPVLFLMFCYYTTSTYGSESLCDEYKKIPVEQEQFIWVCLQGNKGQITKDILIIFLHGDKSSGNYVSWEYKTTRRFVDTRTIGATILRPSYTDIEGHHSDGKKLHKNRYTKERAHNIGEAIKILKTDLKIKTIILIGYSGGGVFAGVLAGMYPDLWQAVVMLSTPTHIHEIRSQRGKNPWPYSQSPNDYIQSINPKTKILVFSSKKDDRAPESFAKKYVEDAEATGIVAKHYSLGQLSHFETPNAKKFWKVLNTLHTGIKNKP